jgi:hypothetical protein
METSNSKVVFKSWRGDDYKLGIGGQQILILGESHYHDCNEDPSCREEPDGFERSRRHTELTRDVVRWWKDNPHRSPLSHQLPKLFNMDKPQFWASVAFYNYLQAIVGSRARMRPSEDHWASSENVAALQETLSDLQPDRILVLGKKLWQYLPSKVPLARPPEDEPGLLVSNDMGSYDEVDRKCYWYYTRSDKKALAMPIMHPSAPRFVTKDWIEPVANWLSFGS